MSETSRSHVTITLGRTGQVVKRDGSAFASSNADSNPFIGSKRPVSERLGSSVDSYNKRLRRDGPTMDIDGIHLSKDDLRHKIMRRKIFTKGQNNQRNRLDLRNVLSRPAQYRDSISAVEKIPERRDAGSHYLEPKDDRHYTDSTEGSRRLMPATRSSNLRSPISRDDHLREPRVQYYPEEREGGGMIFESKNVKRHMPETNRSSIMSAGPGPRSTHPVAKIESWVDSRSPWTLDDLRQRSPDEALTNSRALSKPMRNEGLQRKYMVRASDEARTSTYTGKETSEFSRHASSSSYLSKMPPPVGFTKNMTPMVSLRPPSSSLNQNNSHVVDDYPSVDIFLRSLGLEKYAVLFKAEEVDMYSLKRMTDNELRELGIPMGPRKKIMLSLQARLKRLA